MNLSPGFDLMIESVYKADAKLRGCAYNQDCFHELMGWRQLMIDTLYHYKDLNEVPPQVSELKKNRIIGPTKKQYSMTSGIMMFERHVKTQGAINTEIRPL